MRKLLLGATALFVTVSAASADISAFNSRAVALGTSSEMTLQAILDSIYGTGLVNAANDQQTAGIWQLPGPGSDVIAPMLRFEQAGNANGNEFGIWTGDDLNSTPTMVAIFNGPASPTTIATLFWSAGDPNTVNISGGTGVNTGAFLGINRYWFGFYLKGPGGTFFTADALNGGNAQALTYRWGPTDKWTIAFEDQPFGTADRDYNDLVVTAESIVPAPDGGATLMLLGCGLAAFEVTRRRLHR